jgi:6-phosphogluconolactonase
MDDTTHSGHAWRTADGRLVRVYDDTAALSEAAATVVAGVLREAVAARGVATLCLAGGSTPRALHQRLAAAHRDDVPWARTTVVFGDERCVPPEHEASNYGMARDTLLSRVPVPAERVHRIRGELAPAAAADDYDRTLRRALGGAPPDARPAAALDAPLLDVTILGVGADGHTASLFPGDPALGERERWAVAVTAPAYVAEPRARVTLTLPLLRASRLVLVLVAGATKRDAVQAALGDEATVPAGLVRAVGRTLWMVDEEAVAMASDAGRRP